jgi:hypothetical protein
VWLATSAATGSLDRQIYVQTCHDWRFCTRLLKRLTEHQNARLHRRQLLGCPRDLPTSNRRWTNDSLLGCGSALVPMLHGHCSMAKTTYHSWIIMQRVQEHLDMHTECRTLSSRNIKCTCSSATATATQVRTPPISC